LCTLPSIKKNLNKFISQRVFPIKDESQKLNINNYNNPLGFKGMDNSILLKLLNKDEYGLHTKQFIGIVCIILNNLIL
jgi:hypothetical protein